MSVLARDKIMTWLIVIACIVGYAFIAFVFTTCLIYVDRKGKNPQDVYSEILEYWVVGFAWPVTLPLVLGYHVFRFIFKKLSIIAITIIELILYAKDKNDDESDEESDDKDFNGTNNHGEELGQFTAINSVEELGQLEFIAGHLYRKEQGGYARIDRNISPIPHYYTKKQIMLHSNPAWDNGYVVHCVENDNNYMYMNGQWVELR